MKQRKRNIQDLCMIGLMTAVTCVMAQISIPMPIGVPMTMQTFAIALMGILLGAKKGGLCALIYILIGGIGVPVFSNFTGGYQCLVGPAGGFILSFPIMAYIIGLGTENQSRFKHSLVLGLIVGNVINLLSGCILFCVLNNIDFLYGLATLVLPFLPVTIIKTWLAWYIGIRIRKHSNTEMFFS